MCIVCFNAGRCACLGRSKYTYDDGDVQIHEMCMPI